MPVSAYRNCCDRGPSSEDDSTLAVVDVLFLLSLEMTWRFVWVVFSFDVWGQ